MTLEQRRAAFLNVYQDFVFQGLLEVETVDLRAARGSEVESEARRSEAQQGSYASTHTQTCMRVSVWALASLHVVLSCAEFVRLPQCGLGNPQP